MSEYAARPGSASLPSDPNVRAVAREITGYWWLWLLAGIVWTVVGLVILQFNDASVTTVGILIGLMFVFAGIQNIALASMPREFLDAAGISRAWRWVAGLFGGLFLVSAVICFVEPADAFAGLADVLGFLFLVIGIWWTVRAFLERPINQLWWLTLISGVLMTILAFWTSGQFFIEKAYLLLVFAGIWALMEGITDVVRALEIRELHEEV
jgi:uncharacterized membrane protein HdeD (DUF308 family)